MSSVEKLSIDQITKENPLLSNFRSIIETSFYRNNVHKVTRLSDCYILAKNALGTIVTDIPVYQPEKLELPADAKVLVSNDGKIVGRSAMARRIIGDPEVDTAFYSGLLREAIYQSSQKDCYHSEVYVGLSADFMIKCHLQLPKGFEHSLYAYLLNFQSTTSAYHTQYTASAHYEEGDIYVYADPTWVHPDFPDGLVLIDHKHNVAAVLGLRYFGELKKATLTLAWAIAHRNGFIACHGGLKQYNLVEKKYTMAVFGLSGSGKSTITLADHQNQHNVTVLHDDAFIISKKNGSTTALEPAYFDKTQDYPMKDPSINFFLTGHNIGVTLNEQHQKVLVTEDIRNNNGRTIKSRYATPNRKDHLPEKLDAVYWIMKDDSLPPIVKIDDPVLAAIFGLTLATKRSTAENVLPETDLDRLVIEPFANPFRAYPLTEDYQDFKELFEQQTVDCYVLNTGYFNGQKISPQQTLSCIEAVINNTETFLPFGPLSSMSYAPTDSLLPDFHDPNYLVKIQDSLSYRLDFIQQQKNERQDDPVLPNEIELFIQKLIDELEAAKAAISE
ncbi:MULTISPECIES: phosphoenolpyruvate carboxykinase (ATP) [unclassified Enterococcus]|uniref:phosphoenolpyruvate carboxykinase (ATP) n=1 Tax=unclassified Enterococcus TaxID=2608891 RepID=UPI001CE0D012|nr:MULTISPECIES: phosphoenolpyruvate carboxykinase (ATP) [unclassified Enterococcus]MCA5012933.1 phosphoenolpyruvate carboxykinase (ATP) [Enterococcus sp. S23]MCA5016184.1 phosphoenolpyruvate carboxykinase (ATP) [Enterococcus sp. S22(2020)]